MMGLSSYLVIQCVIILLLSVVQSQDVGGTDGSLVNIVDTFIDEEDLELLTLTTLDDISNSTSCADLGFSDIGQYRYVYPIDVKYSLAEGSSETLFLPILSTHNLNKKNKNVKKVLLAVHGKEGDADTYFCLAKYASDQYALRHGKEKDEIAIIAPWFSQEQNSGLAWAEENIKAKYEAYLSVYWSSSNWISSANDANNATSTFDALDSLLETSLDPKTFPHAKRIALVGFSAGGQVVARHSWATSISLQSSDSDSEVETLRYIVSDPSSYLYLTAHRPMPSCIPLNDSGYSLNTDHSYCTAFSSDSDVVPNIDSCSSYNSWKYGLGGFGDTATYSYLTPFVGDSDAIEQQTTKLRSKDVRFILGGSDVCNCNSAGYTNPQSTTCYPSDTTGSALECSPNDINSAGCCDTYPASTNNELSTSCSSELQGYNRLQRGLVYMDYLKWHWQDHSYTPRYTVLADLTHDADIMYKSDIFAAWAFSDDEAEEEMEVTEDVVHISLSEAAKPRTASLEQIETVELASTTGASANSNIRTGTAATPSSPPVIFMVLVVMTAFTIGLYTYRSVNHSLQPSALIKTDEEKHLISKSKLVGAI